MQFEICIYIIELTIAWEKKFKLKRNKKQSKTCQAVKVLYFFRGVYVLMYKYVALNSFRGNSNYMYI